MVRFGFIRCQIWMVPSACFHPFQSTYDMLVLGRKIHPNSLEYVTSYLSQNQYLNFETWIEWDGDLPDFSISIQFLSHYSENPFPTFFIHFVVGFRGRLTPPETLIDVTASRIRVRPVNYVVIIVAMSEMGVELTLARAWGCMSPSHPSKLAVSESTNHDLPGTSSFRSPTILNSRPPVVCYLDSCRFMVYSLSDFWSTEWNYSQ